MTRWGGIEAGGTKFVCAVGSGPGELLARMEFATATLDRTLTPVLDFFRRHGPLAAVGIAAFGPLDLHTDSPTYGFITSTPKTAWQDFDFAGTVARGLGVPVAIDTDVNGAALAEHRWGAAQGLDSVLYLTVGTGIGGGALVGGRPLHGLLHPELGHIRVPHDWAKDPFPGVCAFHGGCLEGLASGPAIAQRWRQRGDLREGQTARDLPPEHPAWDLEAGYLAHGLATFVCTLSPERVIVGGGVMQQPQLLDRVRVATQASLNGYLRVPAVLDHIGAYLVSPQLGNDAGVLGAIALAQTAAV